MDLVAEILSAKVTPLQRSTLKNHSIYSFTVFHMNHGVNGFFATNPNKLLTHNTHLIVLAITLTPDANASSLDF